MQIWNKLVVVMIANFWASARHQLNTGMCQRPAMATLHFYCVSLTRCAMLAFAQICGLLYQSSLRGRTSLAQDVFFGRKQMIAQDVRGAIWTVVEIDVKEVHALCKRLEKMKMEQVEQLRKRRHR